MHDHPRRTPDLPAALALLLFLAPVWADTIVYRAESGKQPKHDVTVSEETSTKITWAPTGSKSTKDETSFDVDFVDYIDASDEFKRAMGYYRKGSWYDAIRNFETALKDARAPIEEDEFPTVRRWWVEQYANYYLGECHRERGARQADEYEKAELNFQAVIDITPPSRFLGQAMVGLARVKAATGDSAAALQLLDQVLDLAAKREIAPYISAEALLARAEMNRAAGNSSQAASDYRQLAETLSSSQPDEAMRYRLAAAFTLLDAGNDSAARGDFEAIQKAYPDSGLAQAGASNGMGMIALKRGQAQEAAEAFAHTLAYHGAYPLEYERALKGMADAVRELGSKQKNGDDLAADLIRELRMRNPKSPLLEGELDTGDGRNRGSREDEDEE